MNQLSLLFYSRPIHSTKSKEANMGDALKNARKTAKGQFTRAEKKLADALAIQVEADRLPISTIKRRFADVSTKWEDAQNAHDDYVRSLTDKTEQELLTEEVWIKDISDRFDTLEVLVDKYIEKAEKTVAAPIITAPDPNDDGNRQPNNMLKFDRIKLSSYCGDIRKYPEFKETFTKHVQPSYPADQLAFVLRNHLTDSVREEVSNVGDDYAKLWERLDQKYGNVGKLIDAIIFQIKNLPIGSTDSQSTLKMINIVEKAYRDLQHLQQQGEMHNSQTISTIEERLPMNIRHEWVKLVASKQLGSTAKFEMLLELLGDWKCRLEYASDSIRVAPEARGTVYFLDEPNRGGNDNNADRSNQTQRPGCWLHRLMGGAAEHPVWRCREFKARPVNERIQLVVANRVCQVCLLQNCPGIAQPIDCPKKFKCTVTGCGKIHNQLLHTDPPPPPPPPHNGPPTTILPIQ